LLPLIIVVRTYPVEERGHLLWIWMNNPALAIPDDIIDIAYLEEPS